MKNKRVMTIKKYFIKSEKFEIIKLTVVTLGNLRMIFPTYKLISIQINY